MTQCRLRKNVEVEPGGFAENFLSSPCDPAISKVRQRVFLLLPMLESAGRVEGLVVEVPGSDFPMDGVGWGGENAFVMRAGSLSSKLLRNADRTTYSLLSIRPKMLLNCVVCSARLTVVVAFT